MRTGNRTDTGATGAPRRRVSLHHQCFGALLEGWNALTEKNKIIQWADGLFRRTCIMICAFLTDQPEADTYCCDTSSSCKLCHCPKDKVPTNCMSQFNIRPKMLTMWRRKFTESPTDSVLVKRSSSDGALYGHPLIIVPKLPTRGRESSFMAPTSCTIPCGVFEASMSSTWYVYVCDFIHVIFDCMSMYISSNCMNDRCTRTPCTPTTTALLCISSTQT